MNNTDNTTNFETGPIPHVMEIRSRDIAISLSDLERSVSTILAHEEQMTAYANRPVTPEIEVINPPTTRMAGFAMQESAKPPVTPVTSEIVLPSQEVVNHTLTMAPPVVPPSPEVVAHTEVVETDPQLAKINTIAADLEEIYRLQAQDNPLLAEALQGYDGN